MLCRRFWYAFFAIGLSATLDNEGASWISFFGFMKAIWLGVTGGNEKVRDFFPVLKVDVIERNSYLAIAKVLELDVLRKNGTGPWLIISCTMMRFGGASAVLNPTLDSLSRLNSCVVGAPVFLLQKGLELVTAISSMSEEECLSLCSLGYTWSHLASIPAFYLQ